MQIQGVMATVLVNDIERAIRFYRDLLGFTIEDEAEEWVVFAEGVGLRVAPLPLPELNSGLNGVTLTILIDDVRAAFDELTRAGVAFFAPPTEADGGVFATLRDSEGNFVQLTQTT